MNIYIAVLLFTGIISIVGYLWLSMVAFKRSVPWGLLVLLLSPITAIVFAVMYWYDARKAFVVYISSFLLCAGSAVMILANVGMGNIQQITTGLQSGKLTPTKAYHLALSRLDHPDSADLLAEAPPDQLAKPGEAESESGPAGAMPGAQQLDKSQMAAATKTDTAPTPQPAKADNSPAPVPASAPKKPVSEAKPAEKAVDTKSAKNEKEAAKQDKAKLDSSKKAEKTPDKNVPLVQIAEPDPLAQKPFVPPPNTTRVSLSRISHYVGRYFIIKLKDGVERRGLLKQVTSTHLMLDRKLYGGNIRYKIRKTQVKSIKMLTRLPDER